MRWYDDGTRALWHCTTCGDHPDVVGLVPGKVYYGRFRYEKRGRDISYAFEDGYVQEIAQIRDPRCVECHHPVVFHYVACEQHRFLSYVSTADRMSGKQYAVEQCEVCHLTGRSAEITAEDWKAFVDALLTRGTHAAS